MNTEDDGMVFLKDKWTKTAATAAAATNKFRPVYYMMSSLVGLSIPSCLIHPFIDAPEIRSTSRVRSIVVCITRI